MQLVNGAQFLDITFLLLLLTAVPAAVVFGTVTVPLTSIYASQKPHKFGLIIDVLSLMLLLSYFPRDSSFISTQSKSISILNLGG